MNQKSAINEYGIYEYTTSQRAQFKNGELWKQWHQKYPMLFDSDDVRLANSQSSKGYHFFEWLAAIKIYETSGYLSLIEQYEFKAHKRKQKILKQLLSEPQFKLITNHEEHAKHSQCPDLFVFAPNYQNFFFCEVKGPRNYIRRGQLDYFTKLYELTGKFVNVIKFKLST